MLRRGVKCWFSLYQGISPSLLASISMSSALHATSQGQLITELITRNIIYPGHLEAVSRSVDRAWFTKSLTPYHDIPTPISKKEMMTSPLVQLLSLRYIEQNLAEVLKKEGEKIKVLDIGCGHGYITFLLHSLVSRVLKGRECESKGIDIWRECVEEAIRIQQQSFPDTANQITFKEGNIQKLDDEQFDIIYCGFYVKDSLHQQLLNRLKNNSLGIWPISSEGEQRLYFWKKVGGALKREYIMTSLFSAQKNIVDEKIQKYFVEFDKDGVEEESTQQRTEVKPEEKRVKRDCTEEKEEIKKWHTEFKARNGRVPTMQEMRADPRINSLFELIGKNRK